MALLSWATLLVIACLIDFGEADGTLVITPDTTESGVQPSNWAVTLNDITPVAPSFLNYFYFSTGKTVFVNPSSSPDLVIEGCTCTVYAYSTSMSIYLASSCSLGSSVAFSIPAVYLAVNPGGDVLVSLAIGSNSLRTTISYTPDSPSPSRSQMPSPSPSRSTSPSAASRSPSRSPSPSRSNSPSPVTASPSASPSVSPLTVSLFVTPDTIDAGAQAAFWNVTVVNLDPVQPGDNKLWSISTSRSAFLNSPAFEPDVVLAGCNASLTYGYSSMLMFTLANGCGYGGTFSFLIPGDYLAINPGGNVTVTLSLGVNYLKTVIGFTA